VRLIAPTLTRAAELGVRADYKTGVQELAAALGVEAPRYAVEGQGPDHARHYTATLMLAGKRWGTGTGTSKKRAEQQAAEASYHEILRAHPELHPRA